MAKFIIFIGVLIILSIEGMAVWWIWSIVYTAIKRRESVFDIEKEAHEKIKNEIKEEEK